MYLRTFGGLSLDPGDGPALAPGPRRYALLAIIAAAGARGVTREKVLGILWSETDEAQARHTLAQTLYSIRRDLGSASVSGDSLLRLGAPLASDVGRFVAAIASDQVEEAASLYAGDFLDGFYLPGAPGFERWADETRLSLRRSAQKALETSALRRSSAGAVAEAADAWRRLCLLDPFNATYAESYVRACETAGNRAAALAAALQFQARLRQELDVAAPAQITQLIAQLRSDLQTTIAPAPIISSIGSVISNESALSDSSSVHPVSVAHDALTNSIAVPARELLAAGAPSAAASKRQNRKRFVSASLLMTIATAVVVLLLATGTFRNSRPAQLFGTPAAPVSISPVALELFQQGLVEYRKADLSSTFRLMSSALERDSSFALAAAYAWQSARLTNLTDEAARLAPIVKVLSLRASDRDRLWIDGFVAVYSGRPLTELRQISDELTRRFPNDADGQLLHAGALSSSGDYSAAVAAYERVVQLDSATSAGRGAHCLACQALYNISDIYIWTDSLHAAVKAMRRWQSFHASPGSIPAPYIEALLRMGMRESAESLIAVSHAANPAIAADHSFFLDRDMIRSGRLIELEAKLVSALSAAAPSEWGERPWLLALVLRNQGRMREARDLALGGLVPGSSRRLLGREDKLILAITEMESGQALAAARRFMEMADNARDPDVEPGLRSNHLAWRYTLAATAFAAGGDTATVRRLADSVERIGRNSNSGRDARLHHFIKGLLLQAEEKHDEAVKEFRLALLSLTNGYTRINIELARSLVALRRYDEAIAVLQPALRGGVDGNNTYATFAELHEAIAHAFYGRGQVDSAANHYEMVERAWRHADPVFNARYEVARSRVMKK